MYSVDGQKINPLPGLPPVMTPPKINPLPGVPPIITRPKIPIVENPPPFDIPPDLNLSKLDIPPKIVPSPTIVTPNKELFVLPTDILVPKKFDLANATEQDLIDILKAGDNIEISPREIFNDRSARARLLSLYGDTYDTLLNRRYGFTPNTKIRDMYKTIGSEMVSGELPKLSQRTIKGEHGSYHPYENRININPKRMKEGKRGTGVTITHENRHFNEIGKFPNMDKQAMLEGQKIFPGAALGQVGLYSIQGDRVGDSLANAQLITENTGREIPGLKSLYNTVDTKLASGADINKLNVLDIVDDLERPHFKKAFVSENLKRLSRGLSPIANAIGPYLGPAGTALTAGTILAAPNPAEAAILEGMGNLIPGGISELGVSDEQKMLDNMYRNKARQISERKK
jgi:hypothetical protein